MRREDRSHGHLKGKRYDLGAGTARAGDFGVERLRTGRQTKVRKGVGGLIVVSRRQSGGIVFINAGDGQIVKMPVEAALLKILILLLV
jgi:hypothetical protein